MNTSIWHRDNAEAVVAEARNLLNRQLPQASRRKFLARGLTLGGLGLLAGCSIDDNATAEAALTRISQFNDRVQGWLLTLHASPHLPGVDDHPAISIQRFLRRKQGARSGRSELSFGGDRACRRQASLDAP